MLSLVKLIHISKPHQEPRMDCDLHYLSLTELAAHLRAGALSPVAVTRSQLDRIGALDGELRSYALVNAERAMAQAERAEQEMRAGRYRGPLHGVPIAVKDLFWTKGEATAGGMAIHRDFRPREDATAVRRLVDAGAVLLGKLQLTEGAYSDHHASVVSPRNPWRRDLWPGISSSGAGVALAAGLCYGAIASDTGGSIRWPSAANGLTGLKPSWGRVSRHGSFELAATLDHVGPMARSAEDVAVLLGAIAGGDPADPTAAWAPVPDYRAFAGQGLRGLRVGMDPAWNTEDVAPEVRAVVLQGAETLRGLGADIVTVEVPDVRQAVEDWAPHCAVEAAVAHEPTYPARQADYGPVLAAVIDRGRAMSATDFQKIRLRRMALRGRFQALLNRVDLLLCPVHPFAPLTLDTVRTLGEQPRLIASLQRFTCPFNLTGHPTLSLPGGMSGDGLPVAFQMVAGDMAEALLVRAGAAFQRATAWHRRHPGGLA